ncbi:hypothetical protein EXS45_02000, partial [Candidatus Nomurabacteria bacterium]|nr:hypothetical protein [Candidatus Nomurabacteria bacterium]
MKNKNTIRFANSLVFLPVMTMSLAMGGVTNTSIYSGVFQNTQNILVQKLNIVNQKSSEALALKQVADQKIAEQQAKANAIDNYFKELNLPLEGVGMKMVLEAEKNDLDWRLMPAIAMRESTGGKFACKTKTFNAFGWGSCKIGF